MLMDPDNLLNCLNYGHGTFPFLAPLSFSETGQIWGFRVFPGTDEGGGLELMHADVSRLSTELIRSLLRSVDFHPLGATLT